MRLRAYSLSSENVTLGIRANLAQFILLIAINSLVGSLVGFYSLIPLIGEQEFGITSNTLLLSYVAAFGITKGISNYYAGRLADRYGRRRLLILGWLIGILVPILIIAAPNYVWIAFANILLGINQGLAWSMTVIMKIDLAGPERRGLATGLNEFAGYLSVSITLLAAGYIAAQYSLRPEPFYLGIGVSVVGLIVSALKAKETRYYAQAEVTEPKPRFSASGHASPQNVFLYATLEDRALSSSCLAGLVNNSIFGMSWGLFPLLYASYGVDVGTINFIKAFYPGIWGVLQLVTGPLSDRVGRKRLIVGGQIIQAIGLWLTASSTTVPNWVAASALIGIGTALVYPTLIAAVSDVSNPSWRGEALGTYRFWRDIGYVVGAVLTGVLADFFGIPFAMTTAAALTILSALIVAVRMYETFAASSRIRLY